MNFFKKALIAILSVGLVTVPATREVETVDAANITEGQMLYLNARGDWSSDNAWFAAYFYNSSSSKWVKMTDYISDGIYEVKAPAGAWTNVIFCRMNPSKTALDWGSKWNQTADLTFDGNKDLYRASWSYNSWESYNYNYYLVGSFSNNECWSDEKGYVFDINKKNTEKHELFIEKQFLNAGDQFKIKFSNTWDWSFGDNYLKNECKTSISRDNNDGDNNIVVKDTGYYDVYLNSSDSGNIYIEQYYKINFLDSIDDSNYGHYYTLYNDGTFVNKEAPTKEGYTFVGWQDESGNEVTQVTKNDTTLYAKWEPNEYGVTFKVANQTLDKTGTYGESLDTVLPTKDEIKAKGYNVLAWDKDLSSAITGDTEVIATSYYKYFEAKAELGFGYEYDENGKITSVNNMKARFGSDYVSLDSFVGLDITEYGIRLDKGDKMTETPYVKTWKYTSELDDEGKPLDNEVGKFTYNSETKEYKEIKDKEEVPTHIRWALTINNIPTTYYNGNFTYECFIVVDGVEYTVSNRRTESVVSLAETYAGMDSIAEGHKKACQYIVDEYKVVEA